jgi:predicted O-linked N-acetylglucosamine transferase (SPINDLY family)
MERKKQAAQRQVQTTNCDPTEEINIGVRLQKAGDVQGAMDIHRRVLERHPNHFGALHFLGIAYHQIGQDEEAIDLLKRSIAANRDFGTSHGNLGAILLKHGRTEEAVASLQQALAIDPGSVEAHHNLGNALKEQGKRGKALEVLRKALELKPNFADAHNSLGIVLQQMDEHNEAIASFQRAIALNANFEEAHNNWGLSLMAQGNLEESALCFQRALAINPGYTEAHGNLADVFAFQGKSDQAMAAYRTALGLEPGLVLAHDSLLFSMNYAPNVDGAGIYHESRRWDEIHAAPLAARAQPHVNDPDPGRRLRVGYISPDFREHSVVHFLEPLLANHDHEAVEIFCYAEVANPDHETERFQGLADHWCSTVGLTNNDLAQRIREDGVDILVDLAGHTVNNRLLALAEKPAPVQASWLGYGATTGMSAIDYRITDAITDPEGAEAHYSETLLRLPDAFFCYAPPADAPEVAPPPVLAQGHITFGSFNNLAKLTPQGVEVWASILRAVPDSRLLIKRMHRVDKATLGRYLELFAEHGIRAERLELVPWIPGRAGHLGTYGRVDIALDPFPYNGGTTSLEALWMGVPFVTLRGNRFISRMGASILTQLGLPELIAESEADYVAKAVALASDRKRLTELRSELRPTMAASPLCDAPTFARNMEAAFRNIWTKRCGEKVQLESQTATITRPAPLPNSAAEPCGPTESGAKAKPKIRVLHHLARTGGTVISKCLGSMSGVTLLSEIHPLGMKQFNPLAQANTWFNLLSEEDIRAVQSKPVTFIQAIELIHRRAAERGEDLVIRDWTHLDYTAVPFLPERTYRLTTAEILKSGFDVAHTATVRHPINQWLSLRKLSVMAGKIRVEEFLRDYLRFAETCQETGFIRYEDFTRDPDGVLKELCRRLELPFDPDYRDKWKIYRTITGDTGPQVKTHDIAPSPRRPTEPALLAQFEANDDYWAAMELLGYDHYRDEGVRRAS